jgi:valyl-tRNA synthetase
MRDSQSLSPDSQPALWTLADSWIWARLQSLLRDVNRLFESYQFGEAGRQIYDFFWGEFADWYVEIAKLQLEQGGERALSTAETLVRVLDISLRILHPFTPFVTEELWGFLKAAVADSPLNDNLQSEALIVAHWPEPRPLEDWEAEKVKDFTLIQELVRAIRNTRSEMGVKPGQKVPAILAAQNHAELLGEQAATIAILAGLDTQSLTIGGTLASKPEGHIALVVGPVEVYLPLAGLVDTNEERARLEKDLTETTAQIERLEKLLASSFAEKAPATVVQKERERLAAFQETAEKLRGQLGSL